MVLLLVGLSHKSAPLSVRERMALSEERQQAVLRTLGRVLPEAMLVSTCNRVEYYVACESVEQAREVLQSLIVELAGPEALAHLYERRGDDVLMHLFRVASSLDSMVIGEPQILGQVKDAYELAQQAGAVHGELARVCSAAFVTAKRVRTETGVGRAATSMASAAVEMAKRLFGGLKDRAVLVVGAGEMSELAARHLKAAGASEIWVSNRTLARAQELAALVGGQARPFEALTDLLVPADVVICSTASPTPIFTRANVGAQLRARRHRPLLMIDLAVPRDIDPLVHELEGVYAYDVDDIQKNVAENSAARAVEAAKAETIIAEELARFVRARALREGLPVLTKLRAQADRIARAELERTLALLEAQEVPERARKSVEAMAMAIVNKLLHQPTAMLRAAGLEDDERLADAVAKLFGLEVELHSEHRPIEDAAPSAKGGKR